MILPKKHDTPSELFLRNVCYLQNTILITQANTARPLNYLSLAAINAPDAIGWASEFWESCFLPRMTRIFHELIKKNPRKLAKFAAKVLGVFKKLTHTRCNSHVGSLLFCKL